MNRRDLIGLASWILLCFAAAALGGWASASAGAFYAELVRPTWAPPAWLFGPVWTALYLMMSISAWLVWRDQEVRGPQIKLFLAQLAANALWTWLFFAWSQGALATVEIVVLWLLILATILSFRKISRLAAWLLLPYLAWVSLATVLSYTMWQLNPGIL